MWAADRAKVLMDELSIEPYRINTRPERSVHRAVAELRRGAGVLLTGLSPLLVMAAETVSVDAIEEAAAMAHTAPVHLVMSSGRVQEPGPGLAASVITGSLAELARQSAEWLRGLADPTRQGSTAIEAGLARSDIPQDADAALTLLKLARLSPLALVVEARSGAAERAASSGLAIVEAEAVRRFSRDTSLSLEIVAQAMVPLADAEDAKLVAFRAPDGGIEHLAVVIGDPAARPAPLVRLHSECFTGDFLGSLRCDCGDQLRGAIRRMREDGAGVLLYLAQEGRGIGLVNKLRAYALQDRGLDTLDANRALGWDADERSFAIAATMLRQLGIGRVRLLTNNPEKVSALNAFGIEVVERVGQSVPPNGVNDGYLATKRRRFGHLIG